MIDYGYSISLSPDISERAREWRNLPEVYQWCRQLEPIRKWEHQRWIEKIEDDPSVRMYTILSEVKIEIGICGFTSINHVNQSAEFSMYIQPNYQGHGYGINTLKTLVHHGFNTLNFNRIWGEVFGGNPALEMFKKVGFVVEGELRESYFKQGKFINSTIISLLRKDWENGKG